MAKLIITFKDKVLQEIELSKTISIGRETGDILIKNPAVSARHVKIEKAGNKFTITDLGSTNGTFVNNEKITTQELKSGDQITIGRHILKFENPEQAPKEETFDLGFDQDLGGKTMMMDSSALKAITSTQPPMPADTTQKLERKEAAKLFLMQSSGAPRVMKLEKETTLIGSSDTSDIQIKGLTIGRVAAVISRNADQYEITFQGGMARLKVNGKQEERRVLANGDKFSIGSYNFEFRTAL